MQSCKRGLLLVLALATASTASTAGAAVTTEALPAPGIDARVERLLAQMTLEEKVGQLTQHSGQDHMTGPEAMASDRLAEIRAGRIGSVLNIVGAADTRQYQELALQSRLKIPLLFGQDVIHGYKTTFPIPLGEAASWDLDAITQSARIAATEAAASGVQWTFAPMVDIARDPRWGRVMEGAGEDPYLGSQIAAARVHGFQGEKLGALDSVMACVKHFAAYGAAVGGRDYNSVDMSERQLLETYLPPFRAAAAAGAATFMNSFNDLNGVPATGSRYLQRDLLKGQWGFTGFVVSDWGSIREMIPHGYARDLKQAAQQAITAGNDVDMESDAYRDHLADLVRQGQVPQALVDDAVRRVLHKKFELGLFDDPFRYSNPQRERQVLNDPQHAQAARLVAAKSIVLLKNEGSLLPLSKSTKTVALIGPLVKASKDNLGSWSIELPDVDYSQLIVTQWEGVRRKLGANATLLYAQGTDIAGSSSAGFDEAVATARQADVVILSVGESRNLTGEASSRSDLHLPGVQEDLVRAVVATGKPVVVVISAGRPLVFNWTAEHAPAILYTWWLGTEAGDAIADVLFGDYNPSAKLPITFPRSEGQIPIYYNHYNTGRPATEGKQEAYKSGYLDLPLSPRYEFGYGLSYTRFAYSDLKLDRHQLRRGDALQVTATITNTGRYAGAEVVQLYLRDRVATVVRPVRELKDFRKLELQPGESRSVSFVVDREKLSFFNNQLDWAAEPGAFDLMIGASSADIRLHDEFELLQ